MTLFIANDYKIEYDATKMEIEVVSAFKDLILVILRNLPDDKSD